MAFSDKNLEAKIASIKVALKQLGSSLENDENVEVVRYSPLREVEKPSKLVVSPKNPEKADLMLLLEYEKERNVMLEVRINHKDELLTEMTILQNELYANIEELQEKVNTLKSDLDYSQMQKNDATKELEHFADLLQQKDAEISQIISDKDKYVNYYLEKTEESKILSQELSLKEPDRSFMNALERRNQELLLELDHLQKSLKSNTSNSIQLQDLNQKLKLTEEKYEKCIKDHQLETSALLSKINKLEETLSKPISEDLYEKVIQYQDKLQSISKYKDIYSAICRNLSISEQSYDELLAKIQDLQSKSSLIDKYEIILNKISEELSCNPEKAPEKIKSLIENSTVSIKLYEKLADLLVQCSPKGRFESLPSCHQVWKWVTRILEDYMILKKEAQRKKD
ncbi:hypothetical protein SteCoe_2819 [Stentor coeruleus]|uniref:Uncharacterized protein n=1 Tax=Stentor coeruleus TaxID=5963 RepID=A0A1R2CYG6_9CILI|nr:hypothetical protein SteCoe_2819 [Stentor coeruleus]